MAPLASAQQHKGLKRCPDQVYLARCRRYFQRLYGCGRAWIDLSRLSLTVSAFSILFFVNFLFPHLSP